MLAQATEITNPVVTARFGSGTPSVAFANMIVMVWRTAITLGSLAVLVMLVMGGLGWITAGGDKGKIEQSRDRMTQSVIGLLVLIGTLAISVFIGNAFGINLLKPTFDNNLQKAAEQSVEQEQKLKLPDKW